MIALTTSLFLLAAAALAENSCSPDSLQNQHSVETNDMLFALYLRAFKKEYCDNEEYKKRQGNFEETVQRIRALKKEHPNTKFWFNHMSDWSNEERQKLHGISGDKIAKYKRFFRQVAYVPKGNAPDSLDWREKNLVTEVKDQGACGSCYVFSAIGNVEGQFAKKHNGTLISLSEQQGLDCDDVDYGCSGGLPTHVYDALAQQGGSEKECDYTYKEMQGRCKTDKSKIVAKVTGGKLLSLNDEEALKDALYNIGPLSIAMLFNKDLHDYSGGIAEPNCDPDALPNHGLVLVGYGTEGGKPYWLIKNSWSSTWGEKGYVRMIRGKAQCNILYFVSTAEVA